MQFCPIAEGPRNQVKPFGDFCDPLFLWDMLYLILVFVCMCSCMFILIHISMWMHIGVGWESGVRCLCLCVAYFVRQALSLKLELAILARLTGEPAHGSCPIPGPSAWIIDMCYCPWLLCGCWGPKLRASCLQALYWLPISPVSVIIY